MSDLRRHPGSSNPRTAPFDGPTVAQVGRAGQGAPSDTPFGAPGRGPVGLDGMLRAAKYAQADVAREARKRLVRWHLIRAPKPKRPRE